MTLLKLLGSTGIFDAGTHSAGTLDSGPAVCNALDINLAQQLCTTYDPSLILDVTKPAPEFEGYLVVAPISGDTLATSSMIITVIETNSRNRVVHTGTYTQRVDAGKHSAMIPIRDVLTKSGLSLRRSPSLAADSFEVDIRDGAPGVGKVFFDLQVIA